MANRRMFSKTIVNSARFIKMPHESQSLYFHLCLHADDDGVVEAYSVIRMTGSQEDNFKVLVAKGFVKPLNEDLVSYILDWHEHNRLRADRKTDSSYRELLVQIIPDVKLIDAAPRADTGKKTGVNTDGRPMDNQWTAQDRLGKDSNNTSDSSKAMNQNEKNMAIRAYDENSFSKEKTIDPDGNELNESVKEKKVPPQKRLDAENFLKEYNAKYKKIIGGDVPHYPKGAYLKQVYSVLGKYDLERLKGMLDDYFDDDFYKESNWAIWTFLSWKVLNRLNK